MRHLLFVAALGVASFVAPARAEDACACGDAGCEHACTCGSGACPLHRPGKGPGAGMGPRAGMGPGALARPMFDAKTVTTVKGRVLEVQRVPHGAAFVGVHLKLEVDKEVLTAHLGPAHFVDPKVTFGRGDAVEVTGSRVTFQEQPTLLATVVKKGAVALELRAADGTPKFRGPPPPPAPAK